MACSERPSLLAPASAPRRSRTLAYAEPASVPALTKLFESPVRHLPLPESPEKSGLFWCHGSGLCAVRAASRYPCVAVGPRIPLGQAQPME
jgi:hypothetical protein